MNIAATAAAAAAAAVLPPSLADAAVALCLGLLAFLLVVLAFSSTQPPSGGARVPPTVPGLPLLGSALALGSGGAAFLRSCREAHGDAFTLRLLGQRMTFVFAPATLQHYFTCPDGELTFAPAVQQFTHRVFGLPPRHFYSRHLTMLETLRHSLVPSEVPCHAARLLHLLLDCLRRWPASGQVDLVAAIKALVFEASVGALFGTAFLGEGCSSQGQQRPQQVAGDGPSSSGGSSSRAAQLQRDFFLFEEGFELAASPVPHLLQPRWLAARRRLLASLRVSYRAGHFEGSVCGALVEACGLPERYVPNMLLAALWASQANAVPSVFWSVAFLLLPENAAQRSAVVQEAKDAVAAAAAATPAAAVRSAGDGDAQQRLPPDLQLPLPLLSEGQQRALVALSTDRRSQAAASVAEALRLRCFSIDVRIAASSCALPCGEGDSLWVQKGDIVAISPYESHLDPRLYPTSNPGAPPTAAYCPARVGMLLGGSATPHGAVVGVGGVPGLAFGGGKYRCPGRHFAEAELTLLTSLLLLLYDWELLPRPGPGGGSAAGKQAETAPGDPAGLLPPPNLCKLVGIKVPLGPCWVEYQRRAS